MINIYFDEKSGLANDFKLQLIELNAGFNEVNSHTDDPVVYVGFFDNTPSDLLIIKSILEVGDETDFKALPLGVTILSSKPDVNTLKYLAIELKNHIGNYEEISETFSRNVHDILGNVNHVTGYTQLIQMDIDDPEVQKGCTYILEASNSIENRIKKIRKLCFKYIFSNQYSKNFR